MKKTTLFRPSRNPGYAAVQFILPGRFISRATVFFLFLSLLFHGFNGFSQCLDPGCTNDQTAAGFNVNSQVGASANYNDWFNSGSLLGIIATGPNENNTSTAQFVAYLNLPGSANNDRNCTFVQRMAVDYGFSTAPNQFLWDALAARDNHCAGSQNDSTVFTSGSDKNGADPSTWSAGVSGVPQKNDLIDVAGHLREDNGMLWCFAFATTRSSDGDSHVDFEFYQTNPTVSGGLFSGTGPDGGHTATVLPNGPGAFLQPGDLTVSIDYENGGTAPCASVFVWIDPNNVDGAGHDMNWYNTNVAFADRLYNFKQPLEFYNGTNSGNYGYARIISKWQDPSIPVPGGVTPPPGIGACLFLSNVNTASVTGTDWGSLEGPQAALSPDFLNLQLVEIGINLTAFGLDSRPFSAPCVNLFGSILIKTRSSTSFVSELKDFAGPYPFGNFLEATADAGEDKNLDCDSPTTLLVGTPTPANAICQWSIAPGSTGNFTPTPDPKVIIVDQPGTYQFLVKNPIDTTCTAVDLVTVTSTIDSIAPDVECPADLIIQCDNVLPPPATNLTEFEAIGGSAFDISGNLTFTSHTDTIIASNCSGLIRRKYKVTDYCGNVDSCYQFIQVQDTLKPILEIPADTTYGCNPQIPSANSGDAEAFDNCTPNPTINVTETDSGSCYIKTKIRVFTATDSCGNTTSKTQRIRYKQDNIDPIITVNASVPNLTYLGCNPLPATIEAALGSATASDNCIPSITPAVTNNPPTVQGCYRIQTRSWSATDSCGNTASASRTITWRVDTIKPVILPPNPGTLHCNPSENQINLALGSATATDNCQPVTVSPSDSNTVSGCTYTRFRTWTAADSCGNQADPITISVTWTVDTIDPVINPNGADSINLHCNPTQGQIENALGTATITDNCGINVQPPTTGPVLTNGCFRSQSRTWTATDICGNTAPSFTRRVYWKVDTTPPVVTCNPGGGNITVCAGSPVNFTPTATDICDGNLPVSCTRSDGQPLNAPYSAGTTTVICSATDICNNTGTCTLTVRVIAIPSCVINPPALNPVCTSSGNTLTATVTGQDGTTNCVWSVSGTGWSVSGGNCTSVQYTAGTGDGLFTLTVTNTVNGVSCTSQCTLLVECVNPNPCTYTQGYYGNAGGTNCTGGVTGDLLTTILATPIVIGNPAVGRSLTLTQNDAILGCIYQRLPGGGPASPLGAFNTTCSAMQGIQTKGNGSIRNVLLAQTITLAFNLRVPYSPLGSMPITGPYLVTYESTDNTCDGIGIGTPLPNTAIVRMIPPAVISYLGTANTVADLKQLADLALSAVPPPPGMPSLSAINSAVTAFNEGFDECRAFGGFFPTNPLDTVSGSTTTRFDDSGLHTSVDVYPNPATESAQIDFILNGYDSEVVLGLYDIDGVLIDVLYRGLAEGDVVHTKRLDVSLLPAGVYIYHLTTSKGITTGRITIVK